MSNMETDDVGQTEATNTDEDNSKRKLTKEEKKRVYGTSGNYPEPHATRREVLKVDIVFFLIFLKMLIH